MNLKMARNSIWVSSASFLSALLALALGVRIRKSATFGLTTKKSEMKTNGDKSFANPERAQKARKFEMKCQRQANLGSETSFAYKGLSQRQRNKLNGSGK